MPLGCWDWTTAMSSEHIRNIGIIAHVDAGKTTLTEQLLFASGAIRSAGRVDHGTSQTDSMDVERERGISVKAAVTGLDWQGTHIRIIDTPGHADFYAEVERSLCVLDGAVLVLSAVEGVQLQTNTIWQALRELGVPTLMFVNKLDRVGAQPDVVVDEVRAQLSSAVVPIQTVSNVATDSVDLAATTISSDDRQSIGELVAGLDDVVMEKYLQDEDLSWSIVDESLQRLCAQGAAFPVFYGVAKLGIGVAELLDGIVHYLPAPSGSPDNDLSSIVFKIENEKSGRLTHVRVFEGTIKRGAPVRIEAASTDEKPARILVLTPGGEYQTTEQLVAGDIGVLYGMQKTKVGYVLGDPYASRQIATPAEPMLTARIQPDNPDQWNDLLQALRQQEDEDPLLNVEWREGQKEINVRFFGEIQMEIIREVLASR
jgi:ribosomal protection tetracycline resistance protein